MLFEGCIETTACERGGIAMNVRIGLYDFFAYTVPGGIYLFTITYVLARVEIIQMNQRIEDFAVSATGVILITIASYTSGLLFDFFTSKWVRLFRGKNFPQKILDEFRLRYPYLDIKFRALDWQILFARIRQESPENGSAIEQNNVTNLMLRNLSFGFAVLCVIQLVESIVTMNFLNAVFSAAFGLLSAFAQVQSAKFARIFFIQIFEYTVAKDLMGIKLSEYKLPVKKVLPRGKSPARLSSVVHKDGRK